ncbi:hypothetical protein VNO77_42040 [Canavalia gladiata]|uniref:Uncharacterized protein n=1 Tax=Canavalia gladiata TaxID=3824 RepID=A0AAN9PQN5_CANGL
MGILWKDQGHYGIFLNWFICTKRESVGGVVRTRSRDLIDQTLHHLRQIINLSLLLTARIKSSALVVVHDPAPVGRKRATLGYKTEAGSSTFLVIYQGIHVSKVNATDCHINKVGTSLYAAHGSCGFKISHTWEVSILKGLILEKESTCKLFCTWQSRTVNFELITVRSKPKLRASLKWLSTHRLLSPVPKILIWKSIWFSLMTQAPPNYDVGSGGHVHLKVKQQGLYPLSVNSTKTTHGYLHCKKVEAANSSVGLRIGLFASLPEMSLVSALRWHDQPD